MKKFIFVVFLVFALSGFKNAEARQCGGYVRAAQIMNNNGIVRFLYPGSKWREVRVHNIQVRYKSGRCFFIFNGRNTKPYMFYINVRGNWVNAAHYCNIETHPRYPEFIPQNLRTK